jgi:hypothetical protein
MVKVNKKKNARISQGDIIRDVEHIEYVSVQGGSVAISKINFPLVVVLTQDCDLAQDDSLRSPSPGANQDKLLLSVLVAPLYNVEQVYNGDHLSDLGLKMAGINKGKSPGNNLRNNETPRYHYLDFPAGIPIVASVIDFKHYFSINVAYLKSHKKSNFVCRLSDLYREDVSQRFSSFLSRIGLP